MSLCSIDEVILIYQDRAIDIFAFTVHPRPALLCADCTDPCAVDSGWEESRERPEGRGSYYFAELCHWTCGCFTFKGEYLDLMPLPLPRLSITTHILPMIKTHSGPHSENAPFLTARSSGGSRADGIARTPLQPQSKRIPDPPPTPSILNSRHRAPQRPLATLPIKRRTAQSLKRKAMERRR